MLAVAGRRDGDRAGVVEQEARAAGRGEAEPADVVVPVVLVMLTPPVPEPVTVIWSNVLVPMVVPVASRPLAPALVIEIVPVGAKFTVPALLSSTPVAPFVLTVRLLRLNVPVVPLSSSPGCVRRCRCRRR